jgi:hexosaminidase
MMMKKNKNIGFKLLGSLILILVMNFAYAQELLAASNDFAIRGFHLDLRVQVMKMPELKNFALKLSKNGINTIIMEWEATYPYEKHKVISNRYAYSREEVKSFIAYCNALNIDVVPLQQSFGHVEYILKNYRYKDLREDAKEHSQVNPLKEDSCRALFSDLYKDMISLHTSKYFHIGGDETYLLGHSEESKKKIALVGKGKLYGDYVKMLCELVISLGKRPIVWADIALKYPDALKDLPKETIFMDWNYGWDLNKFGNHKKLMETGFEIWGAPALRSAPDNYYLTLWNKHFENIKTFVPQARALGYKGIVMTSWSTSGIYSPVFESASDVIDLPAVRRVYPVTGFNMLIDAYYTAIRSKEPLNIDAFVKNYGKNTYGFNEEPVSLFWQALKTTPYEVTQGTVAGHKLSVKTLRDSALMASAILHKLKPLKNKDEYAHYVLMADIRDFYLACMWVEGEVNALGFNNEKAKELLRLLNKLKPDDLDKRFIALNKNTFYLSELKIENELRNTRLKGLKDKLENKN